MPGADQAYTPGKVVIDASVQTQTENAASPSRIIAASCDGKWTSDEVKWFNGYPTTGMDSGVVLYPPNGTSTVQVARIQADGPDTVTAYGTITSADGKVSHFVDQYGEGAHGWVRDDHRVVTTGTQPSRTVLPGIDTVGYGPVRIGMSAADLESTGVVTQLNWRTLKDSGGPDNGCWDGQMTYEGHSAAVDFDPRTGTVQGITFTGGMATSRGIEMGSSAAAVQRAYPDAARQSGSGVNGYVTWTVPLPDHAAYRIETWSYKDFGVVTIAMVGASNPCGLG